ncbi:hypothetical protein HPB48_021597 [Haemaphysalis longicornis]|uniref:Peptidase M13 N-terminal domain-containing protein n=1 Tax=Haemaphysalis longicornis TaxID=44386 RepID=A0A9J6FWR3_HAELO|nr:hypothetical protein HPB48_021057 [Haemaphysalis longicornis]KAH9366793.1 hypothetical protein HPB48_021597 [Haemaphysalis longicornis]
MDEVAVALYPRCDHPTRCYDYAQELAATLDRDVDPCENFYAHVCGHWERRHPGLILPVNQFALLQVRMTAIIFDVLEHPPDPSLPDSVQRSVIGFQVCREVEKSQRDDLKVSVVMA